MNWLRSLLARLRLWANDDTPPKETAEKSEHLLVMLLASPHGPPRVVVRVVTAGGTVRLLTLTAFQAEILSRRLRAAVFAGTPTR